MPTESLCPCSPLQWACGAAFTDPLKEHDAPPDAQELHQRKLVIADAQSRTRRLKNLQKICITLQDGSRSLTIQQPVGS